MSGLLYNSRARNTETKLLDNSGAVAINQSNIKNIQSVFNTANNIAQNQINKQYEVQYNTFAINAGNTLQTSMRNLFENYTADPKSLDLEFKKVKDEIVNKIQDENIKVAVTKDYLTLRNVYLFKADRNKEIIVDRNAKNSVMQSANELMQPLSLFYEKMYNGSLNERDIVDYNYQFNKLNSSLNAKGTQKDAIGDYMSLFNETEKKEILKKLNEVKVNSGYSYFNHLFENDKEKFAEQMNRWNNEPSTIQVQYGLNQEEYVKIKKYIQGLNSTVDNKNVKNQEQAVALTQAILNYENKIGTLLLESEDGIKNRIKADMNYNDKVDTLIESNVLLQQAKQLGMKDSQYINEQAKIFNTVYTNFFKGNNDLRSKKKGLIFMDDNVNSVIVAFLNKNLADFEKDEKAQFYLNIATTAKQAGLDMQSIEKEDISKVKRMLADIMRQSENIPENQDVETFMANKKIQKQVSYNETIVNDFSNSDPFGINNF